ncbi:MFS transporter [Paenibacillus vulneris]|uniref:MFS transporter n=1 Tax=Paenibacillus vulneris TaxID=1133364 RepID=A0ABW3URY6_9BACL|nr:MFS transporter [Paenibacillus sp. 32352]
MRHNYSKSVLFWIIAYTLCAVMLGTNVPSPLYGVYSSIWHFSSGTITLMFAIYAFVLIPSSLIFGQLSDGFGRKKMLVSGVLLATIGTIIFAVAQETWMLFLARAIQGLCVGILNGSAIAALAELRPTNRKRASLVASVAIAIGSAIGPLYSGIVAQYTIFPIRLPYFIHLILLVPAIIFTLTMKDSFHQRTDKPHLHLPKLPRSIRFEFLTACFVGVLAWAVAGFFMVVAPTFVTTLVGIKNLAISGAVVFLMLGSSSVMQIVLNKLTFKSSILTGFSLLTIGIICVSISIPTHALWLLLVSTLIAGAGHGPTSSLSLHFVSEIAPKESKADAVSIYYAIAYLGVSVPVLGLGFIAERLGMYYGILLFSVVILAVLVVLTRFVILSSKGSKLLLGQEETT